MGEELRRDHANVGKYGDAFVYSKAEITRHAVKIDGVRERFKWDEANWKGDIDRAKYAEGRERDQSTKDDFDRRLEDLGLWGDERVLLVTYKINGGRGQWAGGPRSGQTVWIG